MEPPPPPPPAPAPSAAAIPYSDSVDSSPRSRHTDSWDDSLYPPLTSASASAVPSVPTPAPISKLRLMCSYGGHIVPRPHDKSLCYVGGDTRIVVVDRHTSLADLTNRLSKTFLHGRSAAAAPQQQSFTLKYQLPNEDLDSLISVTTDEDLENMIDEYERLNSGLSTTTTTNKSSRLRLFLFPSKPESVSSIGSLLENTVKSEDWFLSALNGATSGFSETSSVNCLLGLDDDVMPARKDFQAQIESFGNVKGMGGKNLGQDVHSVPDSPMLEATSSFGSASSSLANLPPIRVHVVEDQKVGGIEDQFSQMSVQQKQEDIAGFAAISSPPAVVTAVPLAAQATLIGDYPNRDRAISDDERSEQGSQIGYRKPTQQVQQQQPPLMQPQLQQKPSTGFDLASPDSASSDGSITNPLSRQKPPMIYQDQIVRATTTANPSDQNNPDPNSRIQLQQQQIQEPGYLLPSQFDPQHTQLLQQPQIIHPGSQYIHHHPSGAVPIQSYYQMYPSQQQQQPHQTTHHSVLDQQNFVYYVPARAPQGYNISMQQPSYNNEVSVNARAQNVAPVSTAYNPVRNVASSGNPQLVQVPSNQHQGQYVGYSQVHHPSQSVAPPPGGGANYGYEFADPSIGHVYYAQPMAPQSAGQYQTMAASNLPEAGNLLSSESIKQQVRTSQPQ